MLRKPYVDVGVLSGQRNAAKENKAQNREEKKHGAQVTKHAHVPTNIELARIHEYGTETIPERSFIRSTLFEKRPAIVELIKEVKAKIYSGKMTVSQALDIIGLQVQALIRGKITDGDKAWPPLKEATIKAKGSSKPLIDTGQLLKSVTYKKVIK